ncbi:MAG: hypothetical protein J2P30_15655 [Actinobacteria bacterium]|nr:hypothetical protein [Actinomycetota bacterium]
MTHICPARGCPRRVPDHLLMCGIDWRRVPAPLQRAVYDAYDHGAGMLINGLPGPALMRAQNAAIAAVNEQLARRELLGRTTHNGPPYRPRRAAP